MLHLRGTIGLHLEFLHLQLPWEAPRSPLAHRQGQAEESAERQQLHSALQEQAAAADKLHQELAAAQLAAEASQQAAQASQQAQQQAQQELQKQVSPGLQSLREGASHIEVSSMGSNTDHHSRVQPHTRLALAHNQQAVPTPGTQLDLVLGMQAQLQQQLASKGEAHSQLERELLEKVAQMQALQQAHMDTSNQLQVCWVTVSTCTAGSMLSGQHDILLWDDKLSQSCCLSAAWDAMLPTGTL